MSKQHLFRFGVNAIGSASGAEWRTTARKVEDLGYSVLSVQDHLWTQLAPLTSLITAAEVTNKLRLGSLVFGNDFRHQLDHRLAQCGGGGDHPTGRSPWVG